MDLASGPPTEAFRFSEPHFHVDVWLLLGGLLAAYFIALKRRGSTRPADEPAATNRQKTCFVLGIGTLWVGAEWPIHDLAEGYLFSVHMLQHFLFSLVAPPLLLLGTPKWMLRGLLRPPKLFALVRFFTRPVVAMLIFNAVIVVTHWPALVDLSLRSEVAHFAIHTVLVTTAVLMWWPVVAPLPELTRLSEPAKGLYLFLQSIVPTVPASFLTFAQAPSYAFYEAAPRVWVDALTDQRIAGLFMKLGGGLLLWLVIAVVFFRWNARESAPIQREEMSWEDFEKDLQTWNMRTR